jgi:hypothetical protein
MVMPVAGDTEMSVLESLVWNLEKTDPDEAMKGELELPDNRNYCKIVHKTTIVHRGHCNLAQRMLPGGCLPSYCLFNPGLVPPLLLIIKHPSY